MIKTDKSIVQIVSAAIRRSSMDYELWQRTKFWSDLDCPIQQMLQSQYNFELGELPILAVFIDVENWSVFSSRAIRSHSNGTKFQAKITEVEGLYFGDFKGYSKSIESMSIWMRDGMVHRAVYETGKPSMAAIYAARTLKQICGEG